MTGQSLSVVQLLRAHWPLDRQVKLSGQPVPVLASQDGAMQWCVGLQIRSSGQLAFDVHPHPHTAEGQPHDVGTQTWIWVRPASEAQSPSLWHPRGDNTGSQLPQTLSWLSGGTQTPPIWDVQSVFDQQPATP